MRLDEWLEDWLELYKTEVRDNTRRMYQQTAARICADMGAVDLATMGAEELLALRRWMLTRAKESPRQAQIERTTMVQAFRKAASLGLTEPRDWVEVFPALSHRAAETRIFSLDELRRYCAAVEESGEPLGVLLLLCCCGLRRCEALGARWSDWARPVLTVSGQRVRGTWQPPKSRAGTRSLILPDRLGDLIDQQPRRLRSPYICDASEHQIRAAHLRVMDWAGLDGVTLHGLRHTFATMAAADGCALKLLQTALGHSKIALTADLYAGHQLPPSPIPAQVLRAVI